MKMRIYGFSWAPDHLPKVVPATAVFERIQQVAGDQFGDYLAAATLEGDWWAGVMLKVRDSKTLTTLKKEQGVLVFTAERLESGESAAEPNFFIAHKSNGHGLYCHHHLSASMVSDFAYYCHHRFKEIRDERFEAATSTSGMTQNQKDKVWKDDYKGRLALEQILKPGTFDAHVKALKKVSKLEANLVSFELKEAIFLPLTLHAKRKKVLLNFDPNAHQGVIADSIADCRGKGMFEKATVVGEDAAGVTQTYRLSHDNQIFGEHDYDTMVAALTLRFDSLADSIRSSAITKMLLKRGDDGNVRKSLGIV
jgi:hypothetical protein